MDHWDERAFYETARRINPSPRAVPGFQALSRYTYDDQTFCSWAGDRDSYQDEDGRVWRRVETRVAVVAHDRRNVEVANQLVEYFLQRELDGTLYVPQIYNKLFHRTRQYADTVRRLVAATIACNSSRWADAACLLVDWSIDVLRHPEVGFERFLHSQRESIYWILDDALLRVCVDQWDAPSSNTPWDVATASLRVALSKAERYIPEWIAKEYEELRKWDSPAGRRTERDLFEVGYFRRSRKFLQQSCRIHELWRTMKMCAEGQLPAELARAIVEDVSRSEKLPMGELRPLFFPRKHAPPVPTDDRGLVVDPFGASAAAMIARIQGFAS
ncbi:hypothetical protein ACN47E_001942 [Coniothyrium glycines]